MRRVLANRASAARSKERKRVMEELREQVGGWIVPCMRVRVRCAASGSLTLCITCASWLDVHRALSTHTPKLCKAELRVHCLCMISTRLHGRQVVTLEQQGANQAAELQSLRITNSALSAPAKPSTLSCSAWCPQTVGMDIASDAALSKDADA